MGKKLQGLQFSPKWVSHLGCVEGCLDYLGIRVSNAWLYGGTGHAFIINMHDEVCPSGPTAWHTEMLFKLGKNIGYNIEGVVGHKSEGDFAEKRKIAWENTRRAIDDGLPCYGWELGIPEYYVVYGYDDEDRYLACPQFRRDEARVPWQKLGDTDIGVLEMFTVRPDRASNDATTVKEAIEFALEHARSPAKWIFPMYKAGLYGYDNWIRALDSGKTDSFGTGYNAAVWGECRRYAVEFLKEARERIDGSTDSLFDEATASYQTVAEELRKVSELFPFPPKGNHVNDEERCKSAVAHLRTARNAEEAGLEMLGKIAAAL